MSTKLSLQAIRSVLLWTALVLTIANIVIYINRNAFSYEPFSNEGDLYEPHSLNNFKWKQVIDDYPAVELAQAKQVLNQTLSLAGKGAEEKIKLIGNFIRSRFKNQEGTPSTSLSALSPFQQFNLLSKDSTEKLWCGNYAAMFAWFCWSEGITTRIIEIMQPGDHHTVNECYLSEKKKWVMIDLTHNLLIVEDKRGEPLHTLAFIRQFKDSGDLLSYQSVQDTVAHSLFYTRDFTGKKYFTGASPLYYYQRVNLEKIYATGNKIKRYFLPRSWYRIYPPYGHYSDGTKRFYVKLGFIYAWIIVLFALLGLFLFRRK